MTFILITCLHRHDDNTPQHIYVNLNIEYLQDVIHRKKYKSASFFIYVHDSVGDNSCDGTYEYPVKTIQVDLSLTRTLRAVHDSESTLCITIRVGTYHLGTNATSSSSQLGAIALRSNDSKLVIEKYPGERVILSGGTLHCTVSY